MKVGFTGTQEGLTIPQVQTLIEVFEMVEQSTVISEFHHGDCIGADKMAALAAQDLGATIVGHPPDNPSKRCFFESDEQRDEKPYLVRNHEIVDEVGMLIACPKGPSEELRSGTWATVRYARKKKLDTVIIYPDGNVGK